MEHAGLMIADVQVSAKLVDDGLCFTQLIARHGGEEVMFNLVVQATIPKVGDGMRSYVSGGEHLQTEEIHLLVFAHDEHPFVVGCKD